MTVAEAPARPRPARAGHPSPMSLWRLLGLELRRNAMPWMFPLLAALFVFDPFRTAMDYPPLWDIRASVVVNKLLPDFVAFVAGVAAWMGSRDSRRHTADLVTATPRPRWAAWLVTWASHDYLGRHPLSVRGGGDLRRYRYASDLGSSAVVAGGRRLRRVGRD